MELTGYSGFGRPAGSEDYREHTFEHDAYGRQRWMAFHEKIGNTR